MIGIEISINGGEPIVAAAKNHLIASFSFGYFRNTNFVVGFAPSRVLTWLEDKPKMGDKVSIKIVETDKVSPALRIEDSEREDMIKMYQQYKAKLQEKGLI